MKVIGLTGGIGTGKSTASEYLKKKGFACIDADEIGRNITRDGSPFLEIIKRGFGCVNPIQDDNQGSDRPLGDKASNGLTLDRKALANLIFNDDKKKQEYDELIHTEIIKEIDRQIDGYHEDDYVILDAPLLFEANLENRCNKILLITTDLQKRVERVCNRDHVSPEHVHSRIKSQLDDDVKRDRSDYAIDNSGDIAELHAQIDKFIDEL